MPAPYGPRIISALTAHVRPRAPLPARALPALVVACLALCPADAYGPRRAAASRSTRTVTTRAQNASTARGGCGASARAALEEGERLRAEWKEASLRAAAGKFEEARSCFAREGDSAAESDALKRRGDIHYELTEYEQALAAYGSALRLCVARADRRCEAELQARRAFVLAHLSRNKEADAAGRASVALAQASGDAELEVRALGALGHACYYAGRTPEARTHLERARSLARAEHDPEARAQILLDLGYLRVGEGDAQGSLALMREALALWEAAGHARGRAQAQRAVGIVLTHAGEEREALKLQRESLRLARETGDREGEAATENNIAFLYATLGRHEDALEMYSHALSDFAAVGNTAGSAQTFQYVGHCYAALGDPVRARANYEAGLAASRRIGDPVLEAYAVNNLGVLDQSDGRAREALVKFRRALGAFEEARETRWQAFTLVNIGYALETLGDGAGALSAYERALGLMRSAGDGTGELLARHNFARALADAGRLEEARAQIETALGLVEVLRAKVFGQELRTSYFATVHQHYELYVDVLMRLSRERGSEELAALALRASEQSRARALLETLAGVRADIRQGVEPALLEREESLRRRLDAASWRLAQLHAGGRAAGEIGAAEADLRALVAEHEELKEEMRARSPRYAALTEPPPTGLAEIRQLLDEDTALVEFSLGERRSYVWGVTRDSFASGELPPRAEIEREAHALRELLTIRQQVSQDEGGEQWRRGLRRAAEADADYWPRAAAFSRTLLAPVAAALRKKRILFVCDGSLQLVPFNALPEPGTEASGVARQASAKDRNSVQSVSNSQSQTPDSQHPTNEPRPLLLDHEIVKLPSAATLAAIRREAEGRARAPGAVAVLADPVYEREDLRLKGAARATPEDDAGASTDGGARARGVSRLDSSGRVSPFRLASAARVKRRRGDEAGRRNDGPRRRGGERPGVLGEDIRRLPSSRREAAAIMSVVPEGAGLELTDFAATREAALDPALARYRVVHFAAHGLFDEQRPEQSCVVLSLYNERGEAQNGRVMLRDIYNLNMPVELVVLSACRTGLGREVRGEGLVGLARAFMYAGSSSVLASLWDVDDEATSELMREFYRGLLRENLTPAEALRAARLSMWRTKRWRAPYYWAAFVLHGEYRGQQPAAGQPQGDGPPSRARARWKTALLVAPFLVLAVAAFAFYARGRRRGRNSRPSA